MSLSISTAHTFDTEYSADSVEWCPHPDYVSHFVCGTYQLEGDNAESSSPPCRRKGRIYLFRFDAATDELVELQRLETAAILDMKWLMHQWDRQPLLAAANALGQVSVYELQAGGGELAAKAYIDLNIEQPNLLALSLDWDSHADGSGRRILVSDSRGDIALLQYHFGANTLEKCKSWSAHSFEAWICAFDKWDANRVYTGGDDTFLHAYDLRTAERTLTNKSHLAGVTCLLSHPRHENILLTGSYDETLRAFDTRAMRQPVGELNLGGGIWRLKADPFESGHILAACMYENFSIVRVGGDAGDDFTALTLAGAYKEPHRSICYGSDWCLDTKATSKGNMYVALCSFYDHILSIAKVTATN